MTQNAPVKTSPNGGPAGALTWANLISLVAVLFVMAAGGWSLFQSQFASVSSTIALQAKANEEAARTLASQLIRSQDGFRTEIKDLYDELKSRIADIHGELRHDFVSVNEFRQFEARLDSVQKRLDVIETTRPTTGELSSTATAVGKQVEFVQRQIDLLESRQSEMARTSPRTPVESREVDLLTNQLSQRIDALSRRVDDFTAAKSGR
jgi:polyhydroxyalkanoate synthesis regulator phasin